MKKIIGLMLLTIVSTSAYAFGLDDAVNATQKASEAAKVVDDTGLVKNSGKAVKGTKTVEKVTKTAADTMAEDEKKENGDTKTSSTEKTEDDVKNKTEAPAADTAPKAVVGSEPAATTPEK